MPRKTLPDTRRAIVHKFHVGAAKGYIRAGLDSEGKLGEVFINMDKSNDAGPWGCIGILVSMSLQRGVPLQDIVRKLSHTQFEPMGITRNKSIPMASSVMDYIVRWLWSQFGDGSDPLNVPGQEDAAFQAGGS